jgi:transcriptional regulator GlxA family with amidase domain
VRIAVALFEGVEELDWAGPWEVFASWADQWPSDGVEVFTVSDDDQPIRCAKGIRVLGDRRWEDLGDVDVLVYPGGHGTRAQLGDERVRGRVRNLAQRETLMTSVCTGSLIYADAGLLDGRPATTHWDNLEDLVRLGKHIEVRPTARFVDDGNVVTAAGVSAGIDMAFHIIGRLHSPTRARDVRRYIQYDPQPPY